MMKRIALLTLVLGMVCTVRGQIYEIVGEEVCWNPTGTAIDSSLTRYILLSTRTPENTAVLAYVDENGNVADVSGGGTFTHGFCGCCGGDASGAAANDGDFKAVDLGETKADEPIWRTGKMSIGIADSTAYKLFLSGSFRIVPDSLYSIFDWQNSLDTAGTDYHTLFFAAPSTGGRKPSMTGGRNHFTIGSSSTMLTNQRLGVLAFSGNNPSDTDQLLGAFIEAVASEQWDGSGRGTDLLFWAIDTATLVPQNIMTLYGTGRAALPQYAGFDDGSPTILAGFDGSENITRHPVDGAATEGFLIGIGPNGLEFKDSTIFANSGFKIFENLDSLEADTELEAGEFGILQNGAIYKIQADSISGLAIDHNTVAALSSGLHGIYFKEEYVNVNQLDKTREENINDAMAFVNATNRSNRSVYIEGGSFDPADLVFPTPTGSREMRLLVHGAISLDTTLILPSRYHLEGVGAYSNEVQFAHFSTGAVLSGQSSNAAVVATSGSTSNSIKNISIDAFGGTGKIGLLIYDSPSVILEEIAVNHIYIGIQVINSYWVYADKITTRASTGNGTYGIHLIDDRAVSSNVCHLQFWSNVTFKGPCLHMEPRSGYNMNSINFTNISTEVKQTPVVTFDVSTDGRIFNCSFANIHTADDTEPHPIFKVVGGNRSQEVNRIFISNVKNSDNTALVDGYIWNATIVNANNSAGNLRSGSEINQGIVARDRVNDFDLQPTYQLPGQKLFVANDTSDLSFLSRDAVLGTVIGPDGISGSGFSVTNNNSSSQVRAYANGSIVLPDDHYLVLGGWFKNSDNAFLFKIRSLVSGFVMESGDSIAVDEKESVGFGPVSGNAWTFSATALKIVNPGNASGTMWIEVSNSSTGDTTYGEYANLFGVIVPDSLYNSTELSHLVKGIGPQYEGAIPGNVATGYSLETTQSLIVGDSLIVSGAVQFSGLSDIEGTRTAVMDDNGNLGYKENSLIRTGCVTIDSVNSVWVTHGLGVEPELIEVYPRADVGAYFIDSITATQFKLNWQHINPGNDICWRASNEPSQAAQEYANILSEYGGVSVSDVRQKLDIEHINRLKAIGVWDKLDALWWFEHENDTIANVNWITPGTHSAINNGASWSTAGYQTAGATPAGGFVSTDIRADTDLDHFKVEGGSGSIDLNLGWYATGYSNGTSPDSQQEVAGFGTNFRQDKRNLLDRVRYYIFSSSNEEAQFDPDGMTQIKRQSSNWTLYTGTYANVETRSDGSYLSETGVLKFGDADTTALENTGALFKMAYLGGGLSTAEMQAFETEVIRYRAALSASYTDILIHKHDADQVQHVGYGQENREASDLGKTIGTLAAYATDGTLLDLPIEPDTVTLNFQHIISHSEAIIDTMQRIMWIVPDYMDGDTIIGFSFMVTTPLSGAATDVGVCLINGGYGGAQWFNSNFTSSDQFKDGYLPVAAGMPIAANDQIDFRTTGFTGGAGTYSGMTVQVFIRRKKIIP